MKEVIMNNVMNNIAKNYDYSKTKLAEIKYGLESLYVSITKFTIIMIISLVFGTIKELLLFTISFGLLKITCFGLHTKKSWQCWVTSIPIFTLIPFIIKNYVINSNILLGLMPFIFLIICIYAPSDTEKRPLINRNKRVKYKIINILTSLIFISLIVFVKNNYLNSLLFYSLLLEAIVINPLSYKLLGLKYKNYLNYKKEGGVK